MPTKPKGSKGPKKVRQSEKPVGPVNAGISNEDIINRCLQDGMNDLDEFMYILTRHERNVAYVENDGDRARLCERFGIKKVDFDKLGRQRLLEQIRKCKHAFKKDIEVLQMLDAGAPVDTSAKTIDQVERSIVVRRSLGNPDLDWMFGETVYRKSKSRAPGADEQIRGGPVIGSVHALGGERGVGKTRTMAMVARGFVEANDNFEPPPGIVLPSHFAGNDVLFVNAEDSNENFRARSESIWSEMPKRLRQKIHITEARRLTQIMMHIENIRPGLVIIDPMTMLHDMMVSSRERASKNIIHTFAAMGSRIGTIFVIINHLNGKGTFKGGTLIPSLVMGVWIMSKKGIVNPRQFGWRCDDKNRDGPSDRAVFLEHGEKCVRIIPRETPSTFGTKAEPPQVLDALLHRPPTAGAVPAGGVPEDEQGEEDDGGEGDDE